MILLTGGAGFIGCNLLRALNRIGHTDILVVDNVGQTSKWQNLVGCDFIEYIHKNDLWPWLDRNSNKVHIQAIFHLGACSDTMQYDFDYFNLNNIIYSRRLWQLCVDLNIPFIYASSAATYGDGSKGFSDDHEMTKHYHPINQYGYSKHAFDLWALNQKTSPPFWYGLKFFNVYGPHEGHKQRMASVVYNAWPQLLNVGSIKLFKSYRENISHGEQKRDFVYVNDIVELMLSLLETPIHSGLYNAGSGSARTFNDLVQRIFSSSNAKPKIEYIDMPESLKSKYQYYTKADLRKLQATGINYAPTSLEDGVQAYVDWLLRSTPK